MRIFKIVLILSLISFNNIFAADLNIFSLGFYDFTKRGNDAVDLRFNKRFDKILFDLGPEEESLYQIRPFYGLEVTHHGAAYALAGVYIEEKISENIYFTPNIGGGLYSNGEGKDMGGDVQFRSEIELSYSLKNNNRIGLGVSHISNANTGRNNPGTNIISISYQVPFKK